MENDVHGCVWMSGLGGAQSHERLVQRAYRLTATLGTHVYHQGATRPVRNKSEKKNQIQDTRWHGHALSIHGADDGSFTVISAPLLHGMLHPFPRRPLSRGLA